MKSAWLAAFALPLFCCSAVYPQQPPSGNPTTTSSPEAKAAPQPTGAVQVSGQPVTEDELRQALEGKNFYLRGRYLSDDLRFNANGMLVSQSRKGSFTLCAVTIEKVRLDRKHLTLEGVRYGIHFEDEGDWETQATSFDRIRITPKRKHLEIVIDRQDKAAKKDRARRATHSKRKTARGYESDTRANDSGEASERLRGAIDRVLAPSLDARMISEMPTFWRYFYNAQRNHTSIAPSNPGIVRPGPGMVWPKLVRNPVPASNEYAQADQVVGAASYEVILGADGRPLGVAVTRPIGFGLDENAVAAIRKAVFRPAVKNGKAVPSVVNLTVSFRIYDGPEEAGAEQSANKPYISPLTGKPPLPGPYTVESEREQRSSQ